MRMSNLFFQTLRDAPADAEIASHKLLIRAGMVRQLAAGLWDFMPLGMRVKQKVEAIIREEMNAIGTQEIVLPVVHPASIWKETGRWYEIGDDMGRFQDRNGRDMVLAMTHEEIVADLVRQVVSSYRQLPMAIYHIQTKFRDEPRPRAGLIRVREFTMKDAYSLDKDWAGLDDYYRKSYQAYFNVFRRCGLDVIAVESDVGMMGGTQAHEFMALLPIGEDTILINEESGYFANRQVATFQKPEPPTELPQSLEEVHTPSTNTIAKLADFLDIEESQTAKAIFMVAQVANERAAEEGQAETRDQFVFAVVRGDMELNETKLTNAVKARSMRPATADEIRAVGAEPGYGSPIGVDRERVLLVVDDLVAASPNLVAGANREDYHYRNVNHGRDYEADAVTDLVAAADGYLDPIGGRPMRAVRGVEVGNIFKLGTKYTEALGATFLDENGEAQPVIMGSYGIGSERLIASVIERHHDENGIQWPISVAPYQVALVSLATAKQPDVAEAADRIYSQLSDAGIDVLYDDRDERAGVKFNDADLIGLPIRLTVGGRGLKNGIVEMKLRRTGESSEIALDNLVDGVRTAMADEQVWIDAMLKEETLD